LRGGRLPPGEKTSALYNIACCHSRLDDAQKGLIALAGALEAGFDDFATARSDADLATLRRAAPTPTLVHSQLSAAQGSLDNCLSPLTLPYKIV
jgi:hypothetical protein